MPVSSMLNVDLTSKPREDLIRMCTKLCAEINTKNKFIHEMKIAENWSVAIENATYAQDYSERIEELSFKGLNNAVENEEAKIKLFQTLLSFKKTMSKNRDVIEQNAALLKHMQNQKELLEDETKHLKSLLSSDSTSTLERKRIQDLEQKLASYTKVISGMQSKIELWARSSKRNQEARLLAEASLRSIEMELEKLKSSQSVQLPDSSRGVVGMEKASTIDSAISLFNSPPSNEMASRIQELESEMHQAAASVESLERENADLSVSVEKLRSAYESATKKLLIANELGDGDESLLIRRIKQLEIEIVNSNSAHYAELETVISRFQSNDSASLVKDFHGKCASLSNDNLMLESRIKELSYELSESQAKQKTLEKEVQISEARRSLSDQETSSLSMQVLELEDHVRTLTESKTQIEASLNSSQAQIESLSKQVETSSQIQKALEAANTDLGGYKAELDVFAIEKGTLEAEVMALNQGNEDKSNTITQLEETNRILRSKLDESLAELDMVKGLNASDEIQQQLDMSMQAIAELETELEEAGLREQAAVMTLQDTIDTQQDEIEKLQDKLATALQKGQSQDEATLIALRDAMAEIEKLEAQIQQVQSKMLHFDELTDELKETNQLVNLLETELSKAKGLSSKVAGGSVSNQEGKKLRELLAETRKELAQTRSLHEQSLANISLEMQEKADDVRLLEHRVKDLTSSLNQALSDLASEKEESDLILQSNDELQMKVQALTDMLAAE